MTGKPLFHRAMTATERQRQRRARLRAARPRPLDPFEAMVLHGRDALTQDDPEVARAALRLIINALAGLIRMPD